MKVYNINKLFDYFICDKLIIIFLLFVLYLFIIIIENNFVPLNIYREKIIFDEYELYKYDEIKQRLLEIKCSDMWDNQREFLNGIVRKFRPHKIVEIGVNKGGSSIIILNAIDDINQAKLYSIDLNSQKEVGECVNKYFPKFMKNWILFKGDLATAFLEKIGNDIDMVFIDTVHYQPGEILDFLMVLPFLKEEAIVIFHDIAFQITNSPGRNDVAPYIIFNALRGEKFLPSGNTLLKKDIGAVILEKKQNRFYNDYFRLLGGQWQYFPKESHINQIRNYFTKYYTKENMVIFEEAIEFNRNFVKNYPKPLRYGFISD